MARKLSTQKYFGLGKIPIGVGAMLHGWHNGPGSVIDFRAMTEKCPHDCAHCFTDKKKKTLTLSQILETINQISDSGFTAIDYLGEGEPTIDHDFFPIVEHTSKKGLVPIVFTDAATMLRKPDFVKRLYNSGASVSPKCDSLFNAKYQNQVVRDSTEKYFSQRAEAIELLMKQGFNETKTDGRTRMGFDMVTSRETLGEIEQTLKYCRNNNLWIVFTTYLPAGRSGTNDFRSNNLLTPNELKKIAKTVKK